MSFFSCTLKTHKVFPSEPRATPNVEVMLALRCRLTADHDEKRSSAYSAGHHGFVTIVALSVLSFFFNSLKLSQIQLGLCCH
jgi:hypothetical protein